MERKQPILSERSEFIGCSDMRLDVQKEAVSSNGGGLRLPDFQARQESSGERIMGKYKEQPKYNVVSIRVSDEEKAFFDEMIKRDRTNITTLMREAIRSYIPQLVALQEQR